MPSDPPAPQTVEELLQAAFDHARGTENLSRLASGESPAGFAWQGAGLDPPAMTGEDIAS